MGREAEEVGKKLRTVIKQQSNGAEKRRAWEEVKRKHATDAKQLIMCGVKSLPRILSDQQSVWLTLTVTLMLYLAHLSFNQYLLFVFLSRFVQRLCVICIKKLRPLPRGGELI